MKILYIDTSSNYLYTGISADNKLIIETKVNYGHDLSKYTLPEIEKMFNNVSLTPNDIDKIIVVLTQHLEYRKKPYNKVMQKFIDIKYSKYPKLKRCKNDSFI